MNRGPRAFPGVVRGAMRDHGSPLRADRRRARRKDTLDAGTAVALAALALGFGALGVLGVASGDFAYQWQPVPPDTPARGALAMAAGLLEIVAAVLLAAARLRTAGA